MLLITQYIEIAMYQVFLLALLVVANAQLDCPNPAIECVLDPCEGAICPRFLTADCEANLCHGLCSANFNWRGRNVTDRCAVRRCAGRECPGKRMCMEEANPSSCPEDKPKCRQYLSARCVLPPPITDCNQLQCPEGMVCRNRIRGEGVVCVFPRDCSQLECDEGLACVVQDRKAQCMALTTSSPPITVTVSPSLCMQLGCERFGQLCEIEDGVPTCVEPTTCVPIREEFCRSVQLVCEETSGTAQCVPPSSCDQLECPPGTICREFSSAFCDTIVIPPAMSCDELDCESIGQDCVQVNETFAMCVQRTSCTQDEEEQCREAFTVCTIMNGIALCLPAESCDQLECPRGQGCLLQNSSGLTPSGFAALCSPFQPSCETLDCSEFAGCITQGYPSFDLFVSSCVEQTTVDILRALTPCTERNFCDIDTELCVDSVRESGDFVRSFCIATNCNNDTECSFGESCLAVPPSLGIPVTSACVPVDGAFEFGQNCSTSDRRCPNGTVCSDIVADRQALGTICADDPGINPPFATSCEALDCEAFSPGGDCGMSLVDSGEQNAVCSTKEQTAIGIQSLRNLLGLA